MNMLALSVLPSSYIRVYDFIGYVSETNDGRLRFIAHRLYYIVVTVGVVGANAYTRTAGLTRNGPKGHLGE